MAFHPSLRQIFRNVFIAAKNALRVTIGDGTNDVGVIPTDGNFGLVTISPGHISTDNSTSTTLDADEIFNGEWEGITNFGIIVVTVNVSHASITDGLCIEFSSDGVNTDSVDYFTIPATTGKTFSFQAATKYFKIVYTNSGSDQTYFRLQTILKPYYVKPSSHRIADDISDQDDAELVKSLLTAQSVLSQLFENISSYRGVLNVNSAWVHRKIVNETFHEHDSAQTTPSGSVSAGDTSIVVNDATGFVAGDTIKLEEGSTQEIGLITLTNVDLGTDTLTLDRPLGNDYTTAAIIEKVVANMAVNGSLTVPVVFEIDVPPGTVWQITRLLISIVSTTAPDDGKFGGITALTNGVALRATTAAGRTVVYGNWKTNGDMKLDMYDVDYSDRAPAGNYGTSGRWTFTKSEVVAEIDGDADPVQKLDILIQDDLTGLEDFKVKAQGRVFSP
ncbi:hypothetical protein KAR91_40730 [Candidatus Pacearchaeota archaeon]|nr:hypothetical protein [Candidatus Pacearchaeota archaeon]